MENYGEIGRLADISRSVCSSITEAEESLLLSGQMATRRSHKPPYSLSRDIKLSLGGIDLVTGMTFSNVIEEHRNLAVYFNLEDQLIVLLRQIISYRRNSPGIALVHSPSTELYRSGELAEEYTFQRSYDGGFQFIELSGLIVPQTSWVQGWRAPMVEFLELPGVTVPDQVLMGLV